MTSADKALLLRPPEEQAIAKAFFKMMSTSRNPEWEGAEFARECDKFMAIEISEKLVRCLAEDGYRIEK